MELRSFSKNNPTNETQSLEGGGTRNTSEECILGVESITKTVETRVDVEPSHSDNRTQTVRSPIGE
jgi:hypothetical protein